MEVKERKTEEDGGQKKREREGEKESERERVDAKVQGDKTVKPLLWIIDSVRGLWALGSGRGGLLPYQMVAS